jgi:hypothetical protein
VATDRMMDTRRMPAPIRRFPLPALGTLLLATAATASAQAPAGAVGQGGAGVLAPATAVIGARLAEPPSRRSATAATGRVTGTLTDAATGEALVGGQVAVQGLPLGNVSDETGVYFINNVPAGDQTFVVEYLGYEPQSRSHEVKGGTSTTLDFQLSPTPIAMDEVVVEEKAELDLSEYVDRTPAPVLVPRDPRPVEPVESDTSLMTEWRRSMRDSQRLHAIDYPLAGMKVYYWRPPVRRVPPPAPRPPAGEAAASPPDSASAAAGADPAGAGPRPSPSAGRSSSR